MENYDSETGEYFWTEEEQAWVATHPARWRWLHKPGNCKLPRGYRRGLPPLDIEVSVVEYVQAQVEKERVLEFEPDEGVKYYQTPFTIGDCKEELRAVRLIREFNKETKNYDIVRVEVKGFGKRVWKRKPAMDYRLDGPRLYVAGLRIYLRGQGGKDAEFLRRV